MINHQHRLAMMQVIIYRNISQGLRVRGVRETTIYILYACSMYTTRFLLWGARAGQAYTYIQCNAMPTLVTPHEIYMYIP